jgi:hypothetical protein
MCAFVVHMLMSPFVLLLLLLLLAGALPAHALPAVFTSTSGGAQGHGAAGAATQRGPGAGASQAATQCSSTCTTSCISLNVSQYLLA